MWGAELTIAAGDEAPPFVSRAPSTASAACPATITARELASGDATFMLAIKVLLPAVVSF